MATLNVRNRHRLLIGVSIAFLCAICRLAAQSNGDDGGMVVGANPGVLFPIEGETNYFSIGPSIGARLGFRPAALDELTLGVNLGYAALSFREDTNVSLFSIGPSLSFNVLLSARFGATFGIEGGYSPYVMQIDNVPVFSAVPHVKVNGGATVRLSPSFRISMEAGYENRFGLVSFVAFSLRGELISERRQKPSAELAPDENSRTQTAVAERLPLRLGEPRFGRVFPVLYAHYDTNPIGTITLINEGSDSITDVTVDLQVKQYMDAPKRSAELKELAAGESAEIELYGLFNDRVLEIIEGTKVAAEILVEYTAGSERLSDTRVVTMQVEYRNAMTWADDRGAAAFVTARDPQVLTIAKNVAGLAIGATTYRANNNISSAIVLHETLRLTGMRYLPDPSRPYEEMVLLTDQVDHLQFPRETLEYSAGDCDDLSILFCALLESINIETAFVTVPGHIYIAFSVDIDAESGRRTFSRPDDLIFYDDKTWIPVEVTALDSDFMGAWELGAKEWRRYSATGDAGFFPVREAWKAFRPVGLPGVADPMPLPAEEALLPVFSREIESFIDREIYLTVATLQGRIEQTGGNPIWINKLGVVYARYGLFDRARRQFDRILENSEYAPAMLNLANIYMIEGDLESAIGFYDRVLEIDGRNANALLGSARVHHEHENYGLSKARYDELKQIDPELAEQFAYIDLRGDESTRAAELSQATSKVIWVDEAVE